MAISLSYAVRLSTLSNRVKILAQELAILRAEQGDPPQGRPPRAGVG